MSNPTAHVMCVDGYTVNNQSNLSTETIVAHTLRVRLIILFIVEIYDSISAHCTLLIVHMPFLRVDELLIRN